MGVGVHLLGARRAGDDRADLMVAQQPREGQAQQRYLDLLGVVEQRPHPSLDLVAEPVHAAIGRHRREPGALGKRLARLHLAGEQSVGERVEGQEANTELVAGVEHAVALRFAGEQRVLVLDRGERGPRSRRGLRLAKLGLVQVRTADLAHLARVDQAVQRAQGVVDVVGAESPQRVLARLAHVVRTRAVVVVVDGHPELGRDDHLAASGAERATQEDFGLGGPVDVGGVEEVDPGVERREHHAGRRGLVEAGAEVVAADPDDRYLQGPERAFLHSNPPTLYVV